MAKTYGTTRIFQPSIRSRTSAYKEFKEKLGSGNYDESCSYYSKKSGGYLLVIGQQKRDIAEIEAARAMANDGLLVIMTPEGGIEFRTGKSRKGGFTYADGIVNGFTYEQKTPNPGSNNDAKLANSVDNALQHAQDKSCQIPLIYDRYGKFHREHIEKGLAQYESCSNYRFKAILVIDRNGNVWEHRHNKK